MFLKNLYCSDLHFQQQVRDELEWQPNFFIAYCRLSKAWIVGKQKSSTTMSNILMELRKCCNHPYMIRGTEAEYLNSKNISLTSDRYATDSKANWLWWHPDSYVLLFSNKNNNCIFLLSSKVCIIKCSCHISLHGCLMWALLAKLMIIICLHMYANSPQDANVISQSLRQVLSLRRESEERLGPIFDSVEGQI